MSEKNYTFLGQASVSRLTVSKDKVTVGFVQDLNRDFYKEFCNLETGDSEYLGDGFFINFEVGENTIFTFVVTSRAWNKLSIFLLELCRRHGIPFVR